MPITIGTRIGAYEVRSPLGEGGMGVVFRAHDTKLQRDVALKILPEHFADNPELLARFQREAQLLASLNHPNVAQIYGLEQSGSSGCIVMELVEGETLAERVKRGALPVDETLQIAKQIADALESAHDRGIIHRDLKPANIKLTPEGNVKVLDFGLAKALVNESGPIDLTNTPTIGSSAAGVILGTPGYMAPEQARGRTVDKRADIFSFGCVLYEMVTGKRAFDGEDMADALGAIIHKEPVWDRVPASLLPLIRRCLEKDPRRRLRDIGDALLLVSEQQKQPVAEARQQSWLPRAVIAVLLIATLGLGAALYFTRTNPDVSAVRFLVPPPDKQVFDIYVSVSPNGRRMAFTAVGSNSIPRLWLRDLDTLEARELPGTDGAGSPFWSPDNRFIGFSAGPQLKRIDPAGGPPQTLATADSQLGMGAWNEAGIIIVGRRASGPVLQVSSAGGVLTPVTALNATRGDAIHSFPSFLPDGRHFLYFVATTKPETTGIYVGSLDAKPEDQTSTPLLLNRYGGQFVPSAEKNTGHLLYLRDNTLMTQLFDISGRALRGDPMPIAEQVAAVNSYSVFSASNNGVLAFRVNRRAMYTPVWVERNGREAGAVLAAPVDRTQWPSLSPDGKKLAVVSGDLWVYDLEGRPPIKLTFEGAPASPIWTRDGRRIIYEPNTNDSERQLRSILADGSTTASEPASPRGEHIHPLGWSPDGKLIANRLRGSGSTGNGDIVQFIPSAEGTVETLLDSPANEGVLGAAVSPDGRWLAYTANTTDNTEIWVRPYGQPGAPVRVSPDGGVEPVWSKDGRELYFMDGNRMMSVAVNTRSGFDFKPAVELFQIPSVRFGQPHSYGLAPDGRFFVVKPADLTPAPITVILNWTTKLQKQ
jgi:eukaryotic-like serine/threonine-protein kinase